MRINKFQRGLLGAVVLGGIAMSAAFSDGYKDTPMLPGGKWHVHDSDRPLPPVITPGTASTNEMPGKPPSDAVVLFDGKDLSHWQSGDGKPAPWTVENGYAIVHGGDIQTKDTFTDYQLHVEWSAPTPPTGGSQGRGNSGVFLAGRYEIQVLDNYKNPTYADGHAAAVYGEFPPMVNAMRPPGEWQTYDILWTAPRFKGDKLESPAYVTILHNGVVVQNHTQLIGPTGHRNTYPYVAHDPKAPIRLQDHGNPVRYRNMWIREIKPVE